MAYVEFDADEVMQEFGDASVVSELAGIVRTDLGGLCPQPRRGVPRRQPRGGRRIAHAIKGAAGNVAARAVCTLASAIDNGLRAARRTAAPDPDLIAACGRLEREIGEWLETLGQSSLPRPRGARAISTAVGDQIDARARVRRRQRNALAVKRMLTQHFPCTISECGRRGCRRCS
jgi:HPt (histidine-containing phosphotransfer) domain-containing protein